MTTRRDAIARQTSAWLFTLSEDENRVIANVVDRVRKAVPQYGHLDIRTDKRDWQGEAGAEILDFLFYVGAEWLKQRLARVDAIDSAPARADVSHGTPQAGGGTFSRVELGLRELAAATPQVAAPGVADDHTLWSAEMVDGRFDGSSDE